MWADYQFGAKSFWRLPGSTGEQSVKVAAILVWIAKRLVAIAAGNLPALVYLANRADTSLASIPSYWYQPLLALIAMAWLVILMLSLPLALDAALHEAPARFWWPVRPGRMYQTTILSTLTEYGFIWMALGVPVAFLLFGLNGFRGPELASLVFLVSLAAITGGVLITSMLKVIAWRWPRRDASALAWGLIGCLSLASVLAAAGLSGSIEFGAWSAANLTHIVLEALGKVFAWLGRVADSAPLLQLAVGLGLILIGGFGVASLSHLHHRQSLRPAPRRRALRDRRSRWSLGAFFRGGPARTLVRRDLLVTFREPKEFARQLVVFVAFFATLPFIFKESGAQLRLFLCWSLALGLAGTLPIHAVGREGFGLATISRIVGIPTYLRLRGMMTTCMLAAVVLPTFLTLAYLGRHELSIGNTILLATLAVLNILGLTVHAVGAGALFADLAEARVVRQRGVTLTGEAVFWLVGSIWIAGQALIAREFVFAASTRAWLGGLVLVMCVLYFAGQWRFACSTLPRRI